MLVAFSFISMEAALFLSRQVLTKGLVFPSGKNADQRSDTVSLRQSSRIKWQIHTASLAAVAVPISILRHKEQLSFGLCATAETKVTD